MGGGFETLLKDMENANQIELDKGLGIEPEAGEDFALNDARGVRFDALEPTLALDEPIDGLVSGSDRVCAVKKVLGLQWVQFPPGNWVAPAGSYRSGGGGNETVGAFETDVSLWRCSEPTGRNASERCAGLETTNVDADLALGWGRPLPLGMNGKRLE